MRSHETRVGIYKQDIWKTDKGKTREKLTRFKENPNKEVKWEHYFNGGFKMELFIYKDNPKYLYLGIGDKCAILSEYDVRELLSGSMTANNIMRITGKYNNDNMIREFKKLMREKNGVE